MKVIYICLIWKQFGCYIPTMGLLHFSSIIIPTRISFPVHISQLYIFIVTHILFKFGFSTNTLLIFISHDKMFTRVSHNKRGHDKCGCSLHMHVVVPRQPISIFLQIFPGAKHTVRSRSNLKTLCNTPL